MNCLKLCLVLCLIVTLPMAAPSVQQKPYPVVTAVKDGVKTITNPDFPRDGRFIAKLTEEMSCGGEGSPEAALLNKPRFLDVDTQGRVYVMDIGDINIKVYDGQGRFLRSIGRQGQGPGEFGGVVFFNLMTDGRIGILDFSQSRVIIMTTEGRYVSGFPLEGFFATMVIDGRDRLFLGKRAAIKEPDKLSTDFQEVPYVTGVFRTDTTGKELNHLVDFLGESMVMKSSGGGGVVGMGGLYMIVWNVNREGKLYGGFNLDYTLGVYGEDGKKEFAFGREFTPVKNVRFKGQVGQKKTMPAFRNIVIDENKNLWIELIQPENAKGILYDVFSPDGIYNKQVSIEQRIGVFKNGKVYSLLRPEEGYASIKRYSMELVPSGK
ncbi:MAG: 6-bladed beta-propeller [Candidatus Aminicenantales bacterium]